jgi:hypothetical protein
MRNRRGFLELGAGIVLAVVASLLWGLEESVMSLPAVLRSLVCGTGIFAAWALVCWTLQPDARFQALRKRLKRIDWGGS